MDSLRVGIIGIGNIGSAHAACIIKGEIKNLELVAVCDINSERLTSFAEKYPRIKTFSDYTEMLNFEKLDAVIIAVPHPLHADIAILSLEKGLNVLLEKPADITVTKVLKLNEVAKKSGKVFAIMFNQRTNPLYIKAREIVCSGALGELKRTSWIITNWYRTQKYYDSSDWRATWSGEGGGVLINQAPHNLDLWLWICGMPKSVSAYCGIAKYHNIEVEDEATVITHYENGATGIFVTSTGESPGTNRLEISGTRGKLVLENEVLKWWKLREDEREFCFNADKVFERIEFDYSEIKSDFSETGHKGILQNFTNAVLYDEELLSPGVEGINELTISNAAYLSSWNESKVIKLPFDNEEFDKKLYELASGSKKHLSNGGGSLLKDYKDRWKVQW